MLAPIPLSLSFAGLSRDEAAWAGGPRARIRWAANTGFRAVQLDATEPGMRPRELERSARRDLAALLRRLELACSGLDLWIPPSHFTDPAHVDRAVNACAQALELAADLSALVGRDAGVVSVTLPGTMPEEIEDALRAACDGCGARLADHTWPPTDRTPGQIGLGMDPASVLSTGEDPTQSVHQHADRLVAARLSDLSGGVRTIPGPPDGRLDVLGYAMALATSGYERPVAADLRGLAGQPRAGEAAVSRWREATRPPAGE